MKEQLQKLRKDRGLTQEEAASIFNVKISTYQKYERDAISPPYDTLIKIADFYHVSTDYLLRRDTDKPSTVEQLAGEFNMSLLEKKILEGYIELPKDLRENFMEFLQKSVQEVEQESFSSEPANVIMIEKPFAELRASAGTGEFLSDEMTSIITIPDTELNRCADFLVQVSGDSMEPEFYDKDLLLVIRQQTVEKGEIGIFALNDEGYVKKFGGDRLISLNEKYDDIMLHDYDSLACFGKVIGKVD